MKLLFLLLVMALVSFQAYTQGNDSIIVLKSQAGRLSRLIDIQDLVNVGSNYWEDEFKGHWAGVELGVTGLAHPDYSLYPAQDNGFLKSNLIRSNVLNLNVLQYSKGIQRSRNNIGLVTGLGLSLQSYRLDNRTTIAIDESHKVYPLSLFFDSHQKSKLSSAYLEVPLLVEFQIPIRNAKNRLYISTGVTGAKRLETHTKIKYRKAGKKEKLKSPGDYSIRDYKVAGTLRLGYRWINLFATYDMAPMFNYRRGPVLYPYTAGIRLISF